MLKMLKKHGAKIVKHQGLSTLGVFKNMRNYTKKFLTFGLVSIIATVIDILVLWLFASGLGLHYLASAVLAFVVGSTTNYSLNYVWTFSGAKYGKTKGLASFMGIGVAGLVITLGIMALLVELLGIHYLVARIIAAFVTLLWNYLLNSAITFK